MSADTPLSFEVLYRDDRLLAIHKPAGIHVHRSEFAPDEPAVVERLESQTGLKLYPVHRLDRPTSGVLLFALDHGAASSLGMAFQQRRVSKVYHAVVRGWCEAVTAVTPVQPDRKIKKWLDAETGIAPLELFEAPWPRRGFETFRFSLVEARPVTGRRHQIRQHLDDLRHPILGDTVWGDTALNNWLAGVWQTAGFSGGGLHLWCRRLEVPHPSTGLPLVLEAGLPATDLRRLEWFRRLTGPGAGRVE